MPRVSFVQGPPDSQQLCYSVVAPLSNHFKESELQDAAMGDLESAKVTWSGCMRVGCAGSQGCTLGHWSCLLCRGSVPALKACGAGGVTASMAYECPDRKVS